MPPTVTVIDGTGRPHDIAESDVAFTLRSNPDWRVQSEAEGISRATGEAEADLYSGVGNAIDAYGARAWSAATLGGSDAALGLLGGDQAKHQLRKLQEHQGLASAAGEVVGGVTAAATGFGPVGAAAKLGARVATAGKGAGVLARVGRAAAGGAIEGAAQGLGSGVSELALSEEPVSVERAVSTLSSRALYGGAIGGAAGSLGKGVEIGLAKGRAAIAEVAERGARRGSIGDDLSRLDRKGLAAAEVVEKDALAQAQVGQRAAHVDEITAYRGAVDDANPWAAITDGEPSSLLTKSSRSLRNLMDDPAGLAKNPGQALKALRIQEQAFERAIASSDDIAKKLAGTNAKMAKELSDELATLPDNLDAVVLSGKVARRYGTFADVKVPKAGAVNLNRAEAQRFLGALESGEVAGVGQGSLAKLPDLVAANRGLQARIEASMVAKADLTSPRLTQIADAKDLLASGGPGQSFVGKIAAGAVFGGVAGAVASTDLPGSGMLAPLLGAAAAGTIGGKVFGRLSQAMSQGVTRQTSAINKLFAAGERVAKAAPPVATRVLSAVAFAPERAAPAGGKRRLPELYKARSAELREQVAAGPTGAPIVRPAARARIAANLAPIAVQQPLLADRMETLAVRRLEFLAGKMPRRPEIGAMQIGPDRWEPSDMQMRTFARYVAATEDPDGIVERLAQGAVTPEDAEVMREVYPEQLADITRQILERLPTLSRTLPYQRRLALSVLTGVAVDPSMDPRILAVLQGQFAAEPESPKASPQFGSVSTKAEIGTPSERREQRT